MKSLLVFGISALAATALFSTAARAGDWEYSVTPYFWMAGMDGDIAPYPNFPATHTDLSFSDVLDDFQLGGAAAFEAHNGRWGFIGDFSYVDTDTGHQAVSSDSDYHVAALETKASFLTAAVTVRVQDTPRVKVDVLAGFRSNWNDTNIRLIADDGTQLNADHDENWVDPLFGVRVVAPLSDKWSVTGYADVSGLNFDTDIGYQLYVAANYQFNDNIALVMGYRYMSVEYHNEGYLSDITQHGPLVGAQFRF